MVKKDTSSRRALATCNKTIVENRRRAALIRNMPVGVPLKLTFRGIIYDGGCWGEWVDGCTCLAVATHFNAQSLRIRVAASDRAYPVICYSTLPTDSATWVAYKYIQGWNHIKRSDYPLFVNHEVKTNLFYQLLKEEA